MDELSAVFSSPLGLAVTAGIFLVVYLYYRYLVYSVHSSSDGLQASILLQSHFLKSVSINMCWNSCRRSPLWRSLHPSIFLSLSSLHPSLSFSFLPLPLLPSYAYAPFQVLKRHGIKGPQPVPIYGNYKEINKVVCLCTFWKFNWMARYYRQWCPHWKSSTVVMMYW